VRRLKIGTRGSELARRQAQLVARALQKVDARIQVDLEIIRTTGDNFAGPEFDASEGTGVFTRKIEQALLDGRIDVAVHSLKDLPSRIARGLSFGAIIEREDPADVLISKSGLLLDVLPPGARVLTGSPRRKAQVLHRRPDLVCEPVRGNVPTRLKKLKEGDAEAMILAHAGLIRLGLSAEVTQRLDPVEFVPACGQGAMAVEIRADDDELRAMCAPLDHVRTRLATTSERAFLRALGGGCTAPAAAFARFEAGGDHLTLTGMVASSDGKRLVKETLIRPAMTEEAATEAGQQLAEQLLVRGVAELLGELAVGTRVKIP